MTRSAAIAILFTLSTTAVAAQAAHDHEMPGKGGARRNVAVVLYDHAILHDWAVPAEVFRAAGGFTAFDVYTVAESSDPVATDMPRTLQADHTFDSAPPPDVVIVPGGNWTNLDDHPALGTYLRRVHDEGAILLSVCTGAYVLAKLGLLDDLDATSLHYQLDVLRSLAPRARVRADVGYVDSGSIVTAAGAATGLDAALHILARLLGDEAAEWVAHVYLDYDRWPF